MLGTAVTDITITDLAVHPTSRNSFVVVMRGQGADAQPALAARRRRRQDRARLVRPVKFTSIALPNPAAVNANGRGGRT